MLEQFATFDTSDPSHKYDITSKHKLGIGGFAKVFRVIRRTDGLQCALKFIECKNEREKEMMRNEVALMNNFRDEKIVLEIFDQYDFKNRLWIFVELMEDAITPLIANLKTNYSENSCKWVMRQCLLGLNALHEKHVIHRDIKSDNILTDENGNVPNKIEIKVGQQLLLVYVFSKPISGEEEYNSGRFLQTSSFHTLQ